MSAIRESVEEIVARVRARAADGPGGEYGDSAGATAVLDELTDAGFADVAVPEAVEGGGGTFDDLAEVISGVAHHGVPLPISSLNIGGMLCAAGGQTDSRSTPAMFVSRYFFRSSAKSGISLIALPWADRAVSLVLPTENEKLFRLMRVDADQLSASHEYGLAATYSGQVQQSEVSSEVLEIEDGAQYANAHTLLLLVEAVQLISEVHRISVAYAKQREQFGREIAAFPAVQDLLISTAQATAVSDSAVARARVAWFDYSSNAEIEAAAWLVADSARAAVRAAHQVHGAIGMTDEYQLSRYTRRLHQLRNEIHADWGRRAGSYAGRLLDYGFLASFLDSPV